MSEPDTASRQVARYGTTMVVLTWIVALGVATVFFNEWLEKRENPNQVVHGIVGDNGVREIELARNRQGHYVATGYINNSAVQFIVDTGATNLGIPAAVANRLGLKSEMAGTSHTAGGRVEVYFLTLDSVSLGTIELSDVQASIIPDMPGDEVLLGMSFLRDLEIIQKNSTMTLRQY
jgi:aspartyl protease family protein